MRLRPGFFALLVAAWGVALVLLGRQGGGGGCSFGACGPCTACLTPPVPAEFRVEDRVG